MVDPARVELASAIVLVWVIHNYGQLYRQLPNYPNTF